MPIETVDIAIIAYLSVVVIGYLMFICTGAICDEIHKLAASPARKEGDNDAK